MRFFILLILLLVVGCDQDKGSFAKEASFESVWVRYDLELKNHLKEVDYKFNPPATLADVDKIQKMTGVELPEGVLELYKMGNGQADNGFAIFRGMTLLRINDVIRNWQQMQTVKPKNMEISKEGRVKDVYWSKLWLPIASDAGNNFICVDFDPALGGTRGQLIRVYTEANIREYIAKTPKSYFAEQAAGLSQGTLKFDEYGYGPYSLDELKKMK